MDLYEELLSAVGALDAAGIPYALVGGIACSLYVEPRATEDIDFLLLPQDLERAMKALQPLGWDDLAGPMDFHNIRIRRLTKLQDTHVMVLDFLLADTDDLAKSLDTPQLFDYESVRLKVASPETIIRLKQGRMSGKDQIDILGLQKLLGETK
jgi:hypothetical protein